MTAENPWRQRLPAAAAPRRRSGGWRPGQVAAALCLGASILTIRMAYGEYVVEDVAGAMRSPDPSEKGAVLERYADSPADSMPARAQAALAEIALTSANATDDRGLRALYLARARSLVEHLRRIQPDWAPALLLDAQLDFVRRGAASHGAIASYAASYRAAPFLWQEARWRIAYGSANWRALDAGTRARMIDEAIWLTSSNGDLRGEVEGLLGDSAAGAAYQLRMAHTNLEHVG